MVGLPIDGPRYSHGRSNVPSLSTVTCVVLVMRIVKIPSLSQLILSDVSSLYDSSCNPSSSFCPTRGSSMLLCENLPSQGPEESLNRPCVMLLRVTSEGKSCWMSDCGALLVGLELAPFEIVIILRALACSRVEVKEGTNGLSSGRHAVIMYVPTSMMDHPHRSTDAPVHRSAPPRRCKRG